MKAVGMKIYGAIVDRLNDRINDRLNLLQNLRRSALGEKKHSYIPPKVGRKV